MDRKNGIFIICLCLVVALALTTGCARKSKAVQPAFSGNQGAGMAAVGGREEAESRLGEGMMGGLEEGELPIGQTELARDLVFQEASREIQAIYFEYDSAELRADAKVNLERAAVWLKNNPKVNVQVEGHCDERGTNDYNLALGERRALSARRYMIGLGINTDRIFTISYGEERPAVEGHDESAWKFNRRDEFKISF